MFSNNKTSLNYVNATKFIDLFINSSFLVKRQDISQTICLRNTSPKLPNKIKDIDSLAEFKVARNE